MTDSFIQAIASEVAAIVIRRIEQMPERTPIVQPALLTVKAAAAYLGRTEQAVQHLIADRVLPVVRYGRRVHLHRPDLDKWIEQNKY